MSARVIAAARLAGGLRRVGMSRRRALVLGGRYGPRHSDRFTLFHLALHYDLSRQRIHGIEVQAGKWLLRRQNWPAIRPLLERTRLGELLCG